MKRVRAAVCGDIMLAAFVGILGTLITATAQAQECPGHPDALGTSRVLALEPGVLRQVGTMQYRQTLPLADKEVVLTFDDGPLPPFSSAVLDILAAQCIKATYFLIGQQAQEHPALVRRIYEEGHAIGTHTEDHPLRMSKMGADKVRWEIDQGIADVGAALGDPKELAPFFRVPGLSRSATIEDEAAARSLVIFSTDVVADDWHRRIKPKEIVARAMKRLEARGKGILLLHDIHPATVLALPMLLKELKDKGFRIVQVVPAATSPIVTVEKPQWIDDQTDPNWPHVVAGDAASGTVLPVPDVSSFDTGYLPRQKIVLADRSASAGYLALAASVDWPNGTALMVMAKKAAELPAPDLQDMCLLKWCGREDSNLHGLPR
jgi:peptidoglycan-N-acetylglucosamine deacetylase